jgi:hypothetical protein
MLIYTDFNSLAYLLCPNLPLFFYFDIFVFTYVKIICHYCISFMFIFIRNLLQFAGGFLTSTPLILLNFGFNLWFILFSDTMSFHKRERLSPCIFMIFTRYNFFPEVSSADTTGVGIVVEEHEKEKSTKTSQMLNGEISRELGAEQRPDNNTTSI